LSDVAPLVPPEIDLRVYPWMPLEFPRLFSSDTWLIATAEEKVACIYLWCASWHQVPASSLPSDERLLAHLAHAEGPRWKRIRNHAMRGWVLCSDGRFYHRVIAAKALEAWDKLLVNRKRGEAGVAARRAQASLSLYLESPSDPTKGREGKGKEENQEKPTPLPPFAIPDWIDPQAWAGFVEMRIRIKEPLTRRAMDITINKLAELKGQGEDPNAVLDQSTQRNWKGVFAVKRDGAGTGRQAGLESTNKAVARRWAAKGGT
jgi:hypothetical protein